MKNGIQHIALPPNQALQLTCLPVTPLAKRRARGAPGSHAAELGRYAFIISVAAILGVLSKAIAQEPFDAEFRSAIDDQLGGAEIWRITITSDGFSVLTNPELVHKRLCRAFLLKGRNTITGPTINEPELVKQVQYFYYALSEEDTTSSTSPCLSVAFENYFEVESPIEEGTLLELADFLLEDSAVTRAIATECPDCERNHLTGIRVAQKGRILHRYYFISSFGRGPYVILRIERAAGNFEVVDVARLHID